MYAFQYEDYLPNIVTGNQLTNVSSSRSSSTEKTEQLCGWRMMAGRPGLLGFGANNIANSQNCGPEEKAYEKPKTLGNAGQPWPCIAVCLGIRPQSLGSIEVGMIPRDQTEVELLDMMAHTL